MKVIYSEEHKKHAPSLVENGKEVYFECPKRVAAILNTLLQDSLKLFEAVSPKQFTEEELQRAFEAVHDREFLNFLRNIYTSWRQHTVGILPDAPDDYPLQYIPETFAVRGLFKGLPGPGEIVSRGGYYCFDRFTPIVSGTYAAAVASASCAITAADLVIQHLSGVDGGERYAYALCRPPGHHASKDLYGGYCFLNNVAIAAQYLIDKSGGKVKRVAIIDVDYHHGNGTQDIFYDREDVMYLSLHSNPYFGAEPHFCGYEAEEGEGAGKGTTVNIPLGGGGLLSGGDIMDGDFEVTDDIFISSLEKGMKRVKDHRPDVLVISLGVDCYGLDPLSSENWRKLSLDCFTRMSQTIISAFDNASSTTTPPAIIVQEGGYHLEHMGAAVRNFLVPFVHLRSPTTTGRA
eukprot:TRINITY_DN3053_c0_g1_i1.p1 TRINITY_DN3053_c0_g1~~TRINITY_DN3053_c0_g1_i1.p1  ORF type:complete len:416 (+),score=96.03 TRINITY_DN3053_c0_g1_i1:38-1249(+)